MVIIKKILVATDFSEPSNVALAYGRDLAKGYGAQLHLIHVVEDVMTRYAPDMFLGVPGFEDRLEEAAKRELDARVTDFDRESLRAVATVVTATNVADAICRYAKDNTIDLIVTGTHGRGLVGHILIGSVAERVVRMAACPVLTVHSKERDFIVSDAAELSASV